MSLYYEDDFVKLYHGDCLTEHREWLDADVLVTDPPYGRAWRQGNIKGRGNGRRPSDESRAHDGIANDETTGARDAALYAWGSRPALMFGDLMLAPPAGTKQVGAMRKPSSAGVRGATAGVRRDLEAIYFIGNGWPSGIGGRSSLFETAVANVATGPAARHGHPHAKPGDVMEELIQLCPAGVIAEPFAGSGSTLVSAKALGRKAIGVELDERYCEIAAKRLAQDVLDFGAA